MELLDKQTNGEFAQRIQTLERLYADRVFRKYFPEGIPFQEDYINITRESSSIKYQGTVIRLKSIKPVSVSRAKKIIKRLTPLVIGSINYEFITRQASGVLTIDFHVVAPLKVIIYWSPLTLLLFHFQEFRSILFCQALSKYQKLYPVIRNPYN